jgi:hypothetical protein
VTAEELAVCDYARPNEDAAVHKHVAHPPLPHEANPQFGENVAMCMACGRMWEEKERG